MGAPVLERLRSNEPGIRMLFTLLLERLDRWLRSTQRTRSDGYLAASKDIAELERRMKECDG
ncbi:DUF3563 family protein [Paraburkholderia sp. RL18-101-BIB-B]|uniref:DUF3563 family protein n=1 Tax=Paraburkholderia sp. RL18-101-BIB-B TaxID=3031634 RepID=UPI0038B83E61